MWIHRSFPSTSIDKAPGLLDNLKDTYDFINKVRDLQIQPEWYLITADVESLYTNMRQDLILESIKDTFKEYPDPSRLDKWILELLSLTLNQNDFEFDGNYYLQICGIAMGRKYAPLQQISIYETSIKQRCRAST